MFSTLQPQALWQHFYAITQLPHPSGHTEKIRQFLIHFAKKEGLQVQIDKAGNVIIRKPSNKKTTATKTVLLQAHMDMVPQKNSGISHQFESDPLQVYIDGDWVKARNTTLGADNGIGMAAILAVLESKTIKHGSLVAIFTADEETGMDGAFGLDKKAVQGDYFLNLDSEQEGELIIGCAGGLDADFTFRYTPVSVPKTDMALKISVSGLLGGHSGIDIHLERANANKLLVRFLKIAVSRYEASLASITGGSLRNAIPREANAVITIPSNKFDELNDLCKETEELFNAEYAGIEHAIKVTLEQVPLPQGVFPESVQKKLINALYGAPNGVINHVAKMPSVVETSTNLAVIETNPTAIRVKCLLRSSVESKIYELCSMYDSVFSLAGAKVEFFGGYPEWQPTLDSPLLKTMKSIYHKKWGTIPEIKIIHAGLECGIIKSLNPTLDMVSFGPTICFPHSPDEKVHIPSVAKFWDFLLATLETI